MVVSTELGELHLFESLEYKCQLPASPTDGAAIYNIVAFTKGFVAGGANGALRVFERSEDPREVFKCLKVRDCVRGMSKSTDRGGRMGFATCWPRLSAC